MSELKKLRESFVSWIAGYGIDDYSLPAANLPFTPTVKAVHEWIAIVKMAEKQNAQLRERVEKLEKVAEGAGVIIDTIDEYYGSPIPMPPEFEPYYKALEELEKLDRSQSLDELT